MKNRDQTRWEAFSQEIISSRQPLRLQKERLSPPKGLRIERIGGILRPDFAEPRPRNMDEAKQSLSTYLAQRDARYVQLNEFLSDNGISFSDTDNSVSEVNRFFADSVYASDDGSGIAPIWYAFVWNYALFLGDLVIARASKIKKLRWQATDLSIKSLGEDIRPAFVLGKARSRSFEKRPDRVIENVAIVMLTSKPSTIGVVGSDPYAYFFNFIKKGLEYAEE